MDISRRSHPAHRVPPRHSLHDLYHPVTPQTIHAREARRKDMSRKPMKRLPVLCSLFAVAFATIANVAAAQDPRPRPTPSGPIKKPGAVSRLDIVVRPKVFAGTCPGTITWN